MTVRLDAERKTQSGLPAFDRTAKQGKFLTEQRRQTRRALGRQIQSFLPGVLWPNSSLST